MLAMGMAHPVVGHLALGRHLKYLFVGDGQIDVSKIHVRIGSG